MTCRHHPDLWARSLFRMSVKERVQASIEIACLKIPLLEKIGTLVNRGGTLIFRIWLTVFILTVIICLILQTFGINFVNS
jgi:hypothetical protein